MSLLQAQTEAAVRCVLLPLQRGGLLLPNTVVAEVIGFRLPTVNAEAPPWLLGMQLWREHSIPLVSMENLLDLETAGYGHRARAVILYGLGAGRKQLPYYGIVVKEIPHMVRVDEGNLQLVPSTPLSNLLSAQVQVAEQLAWVPDVDAITSFLASHTDRMR